MLQAIGTRLHQGQEASERLEVAKKRAMCVSVKVEPLPSEKPDQKTRGEPGHTLDYGTR